MDPAAAVVVLIGRLAGVPARARLGEVDPEHLWRLVRNHGLVPLPDELPAVLAERAVRQYAGQVAAAHTALAQAREVVRLAGSAGEPVLLLKGLAAMLELYADPCRRSVTDLDLLLTEEGLRRLPPVLHEAGWTPVPVHTSPEHRWLDLRRGGELLFRPGQGLPLEAHLLPFPAAGDPASLSAVLWERSVRPRGAADWEGDVRALCPEHFLIHTALHWAKHLAMGHGPGKSLVDLLLRIRTAPLDWDCIWRDAAGWGVRQALSTVLATVREQWEVNPPGLPAGEHGIPAETVALGAPMPPDALAALVPDIHLRRLAGVRDLPDWGSRFRYLARLVSPEAANLRWRYGLAPDAPVGGLRLRHPFLLTGRFVRGLVLRRRNRSLPARRPGEVEPPPESAAPGHAGL